MKSLYKFNLILFIVLVVANAFSFPSDKDIKPLYNPSIAEQQWLQTVLPQAIDWMETQEGEFIARGQQLTEQEMVLAKKMGVEKPDRIRIIVTEHFPIPTEQPLRDELISLGFDFAKLAGLTLGYAILIHPQEAKATWLLSHEFVHVAQYERMGLEKFLGRYLLELKRFGYAHAPLEVEASEKQLK